MALLLSGTTTTPEGFSTTSAYVNIQSISYRKGNGKLEVTYNTFKDQASRTAGNTPLTRGTNMYDVTLSDLTSNYLYALAYTKIKSDVFVGSADV